MGRFDAIKNSINAEIRQNGKKEITGQVMNGVLNGMVDSVDSALTEMEDSLGRDLEGKVDAVEGKGLSSNDYTDAEREKLASLENYDDSGIKEELKKKQDAIEDLDAIRQGASKGATALQEVPQEYAKKTDVANGLSGKVDKVAGKGLSTYDFNDSRIEQIERASNEPIRINWEELKDLRDNNKLIPGRLYRITDYVTTTTQENTQSAGHRFDIIVLALNDHTLAEEAWASASEFNIEDYKEAYSPTWGEIMIYIGTFEYNSKIYHHYESESGDMQMLVDFTERLYFEPYMGYFYQCFPSWARDNYDNNEWGEWMDGEELGEMLEFKISPNVSYFADHGANLSAWKIWYCLDNNKERFAWADEENGKGVIYRMIDEWGNDCPYDFKNIQFNRNLTFENGYAEFSEDGEETWVYTFAGQSYHINDDIWSEMLDGSLEPPFGHMSDENSSTFHDNVIKPYILLYNGNDIYTECGLCYLNDIVFLGTWEEIGSANEEEYPYYLARCCYSNSFRNNCYGNSFGKDCYDNSFGNDCYSNSFGNSCVSNSFGNICNSNSFGKGCYGNSFGNSCSSNSFGNNCYSNSFRNNCYGNSFGNNCQKNSFGNNCYTNIFGHDCHSNSFGNECRNNTFMDRIEPAHGLSHNRFDNGVHDLNVGIDAQPDEYEAVQYNHVCNGVSGNIEFYADETYGRTYTINSDGEVRELVLGDLA